MYIRSLFAGLLLTFVATSAFGYEMRMWTAMNGKTTEAAYVKYESDTMKVVMQQRDGSIIKVDRDALCDEDWVYVMQYDPSIFSLWIKLGEPVESEIPYLRHGKLPRLFDETNPRESVFVSSDGKMCIQSTFHHFQRVQAVFPLDDNCFDAASYRKEVAYLDDEGRKCLYSSPHLIKSLFKADSGLASFGETKEWLYDIEYHEARRDEISALSSFCFILNTKNPEVFVDQQLHYYPEDRKEVARGIKRVGPLMPRHDWFSFGPFFEKKEDQFRKIPRYSRISAILKAKNIGAPKEAFVPNATKVTSNGSGFFLTEDGFFLTNYHVVEGSRKIELMTNSGIKNARIVRIEPDVDLALLKIDEDGFIPIPFADNDSATLGEDIFTIGFPMPDLQGFSPKMTKGVISSLNGIQDNDVQYQIDASIQPGNSGGPLVNNQGELVGVIVSKLKDSLVVQKKGVLPQNINYAIKKRHVLDFLTQVPECLNSIQKSNLPPSGKSATPETIEAVQNSCAMVIVFE